MVLWMNSTLNTISEELDWVGLKELLPYFQIELVAQSIWFIQIQTFHSDVFLSPKGRQVDQFKTSDHLGTQPLNILISKKQQFKILL